MFWREKEASRGSADLRPYMRGSEKLIARLCAIQSVKLGPRSGGEPKEAHPSLHSFNDPIPAHQSLQHTGGGRCQTLVLGVLSTISGVIRI